MEIPDAGLMHMGFIVFAAAAASRNPLSLLHEDCLLATRAVKNFFFWSNVSGMSYHINTFVSSFEFRVSS